MSQITIIYNDVPDRFSATVDLKSEQGIMEVAKGIADVLQPLHAVSLLPFTGDIVLLMEQLMKSKPDAVFNLFEGAYGVSKSEIFVPMALELLEIPYTGSAPKTLEVCLQKFKTKKLLQQRSVPTPRFELLIEDAAIETSLPFPLIVKPEHEDASVGISNDSVVMTTDDLARQVKLIWSIHKQPALLEEFIDGREFNVAVMGDPDAAEVENKPQVLPVSEISFATMPEGYRRIVSYNAKWDEQSVEYKETKPVCPAVIDFRLQMELQQTALRTFNALGCRDYARVDLRVSREGKPFVIDVNPNPDISKDAGFARATAVAGLDYAAMVQKIMSLALARR
ncbi:MAG: ATP-grasp domain-containing protein [Rhizobacter sp.]|nr:ATP-grasp domain-containing protein [Chlorobiales bacterium]